MKNYFSILFLLFSSMVYSEKENSELMLQYSVLHRSYSSDNFKSIESGAYIVDNDEIRVNVQFKDSLLCYIIYKDPENNVAMFYNSADLKPSGSSDLIFGTTGTKKFFPPPGQETIYLLLSKTRLEKLEKIIKDLNKSRGGRAKKFFKRFLSEIENISSVKEKRKNIASRLEKPIVGGVSFRGEDEEINLYSLTHQSMGKDVVVEIITLEHLDVKKD